MSLLQTTRAIQDALLQGTANMNVAGGTTSTNVVDLGSATPYSASERMLVQIVTTLGTNAANNKNVNICLQHSDVNTAANFVNVNIATQPAVLIIPEVSAQYAATTLNIAMPPTIKRYLRAKINVEASGGSPTDSLVTLKVLC